MNGLDFLAWLILGCCAVFGILPALFSGLAGSYWGAVSVGIVFIIAMAILCAVALIVLWALGRVLD